MGPTDARNTSVNQFHRTWNDLPQGLPRKAKGEHGIPAALASD
jgi:hypothetical protein